MNFSRSSIPPTGAPSKKICTDTNRNDNHGYKHALLTALGKHLVENLHRRDGILELVGVKAEITEARPLNRVLERPMDGDDLKDFIRDGLPVPFAPLPDDDFNRNFYKVRLIWRYFL